MTALLLITPKVIELDPNNANAFSGRANAYYQKNDYAHVLADYTKAVELDPEYAAPVKTTARSIAPSWIPPRLSSGLDPKDFDAYIKRGKAFREKSDYRRAIADFTQAIEINPDFAVAYTERGKAHADHMDFDRAIVDYSKSIGLDPEFARAYILRGRAYRAKKYYDRAITDLAKSHRA